MFSLAFIVVYVYISHFMFNYNVSRGRAAATNIFRGVRLYLLSGSAKNRNAEQLLLFIIIIFSSCYTLIKC